MKTRPLTFSAHPLRLALAATLALVGLGRAPAAALDLDRRPVLRAQVVVTSDLVTVGDFFEGAGLVGTTAIFRAPDLGKTGSVPAAKVVAAARAAGLFDAEAGSLVAVSVSHDGTEIGPSDIQRLVSDAARQQATIADGAELQISFDRPVESKLADSNARVPVRLAAFNYAQQSGRFEAIVLVDRGTTVDRQQLRGTVVEMVHTLSVTHVINRGEVIATDDLVTQMQPRRQAGNARPLEPQQVVGLAARRLIMPGQSVAAADFAQPVLVNKGDLVTLIYEVPGLVLTARAQAIDAGVKGEVISMLNQQSKRVIHGTVIGPGRVQVTGSLITTASATDLAANPGGLPQ